MSREQEMKLLYAITDIRDDLIEQSQDSNIQAASTESKAWNTIAHNINEKTPHRAATRTKRRLWDLITSRTKPKVSHRTSEDTEPKATHVTAAHTKWKARCTAAAGTKLKAWGAIAACAILAVSLGGIMLWSGLFPYGGRTGSESDGNAGSAGSGGSGHPEGSTTFMSYAGPVFPLTLTEAQDGITADRNISYDFSRPPEDYRTVWGAHVRDSYTLSNHTDRDVTVNGLYPFAGSFVDLAKLQPAITTGGKAVQPILHPGCYSGGFTGVAGADDPGGSINIKQIDNWEDYQDLLQDGRYQKNALSPFPKLDQKVTVYEFSDFKAPLEQYQAATQAISFTIDNSRTTVLTYGFEGGEWHDNGYRRYSYFVPDGVSMRSKCKLLVVLGDDIGSYALEGYKNGATESGNELEGVSCVITSYEAVLSDVLDRLIIEFSSQYRQGEGLPSEVPWEMVSGAAAELMTLHGPLSGTITERYQDGRLDDIISEAYVLDRMFYLEFPVTIPAGESITVTADLHKNPSHDYACSGSENMGIQGYDMVTRLGSSLDFDNQSAEVTNAELIEIVRQNFGFDLPKNVTSVSLDPATEHYYLEIRAVKKFE